MNKMLSGYDHPDYPELPDLDAYLHRIDYVLPADLTAQAPSLALLQALHEAHLLTVPFENLSIHYGQPIILNEEALYEKIVRRHRGGFCYELNGLFAWLLRQFGFTVTLLSAEVAQEDGGYTPEFDHLALQIHQIDGSDWLADVGFGDSFRRPLRIQADTEQEGGDGHWYRLSTTERTDPVPADRHPQPYWIVQQRSQTSLLGPASHTSEIEWIPHYRFTLQPHILTDFVARCQYQQTSPDSHFTQRRICSLALPEGRITLSDLRLITTRRGRREERLVASEDDYRHILAERFGVIV